MSLSASTTAATADTGIMLSTSASQYAAAGSASSLKRARYTFDNVTGDDAEHSPFLPSIDANLRAAAVSRRRRWNQPAAQHPASLFSSNNAAAAATAAPGIQLLTDGGSRNNSSVSNADDAAAADAGILTMKAPSAISIPTPKWHAPWKLTTVLSSHLGWVRSIAMDPTNTLFATGSVDRTIKIWDLPKASAGADNALKITLTGHISAVRGLAFSERHPYLFSAGEDKTVKCWDLETNQVVRHYHGHLSGIYCLALHPTLDILVTAGRDAVARVWDIRTKTQVHVLSGHEDTVSSIFTASTHPQVTTASHDKTIKLWDLVAGKCFTTLTHHTKSIRALAAAPPGLRERTFVSASADGTLRKWQGKNGRFLHKIANTTSTATTATGQRPRDIMWNAAAVQDEGVLVSGGDDGTMHFWDYSTGYCFQQSMATVQPGSLQQAENGIMALQFDLTGTRLITGEADKSIKIWKQDEAASELTHPIDMKSWRKECIAKSKERF